MPEKLSQQPRTTQLRADDLLPLVRLYEQLAGNRNPTITAADFARELHKLDPDYERLTREQAQDMQDEEGVLPGRAYRILSPQHGGILTTGLFDGVSFNPQVLRENEDGTYTLGTYDLETDTFTEATAGGTGLPANIVAALQAAPDPNGTDRRFALLADLGISNYLREGSNPGFENIIVGPPTNDCDIEEGGEVSRIYGGYSNRIRGYEGAGATYNGIEGGTGNVIEGGDSNYIRSGTNCLIQRAGNSVIEESVGVQILGTSSRVRVENSRTCVLTNCTGVRLIDCSNLTLDGRSNETYERDVLQTGQGGGGGGTPTTKLDIEIATTPAQQDSIFQLFTVPFSQATRNNAGAGAVDLVNHFIVLPRAARGIVQFRFAVRNAVVGAAFEFEMRKTLVGGDTLGLINSGHVPVESGQALGAVSTVFLSGRFSLEAGEKLSLIAYATQPAALRGDVTSYLSFQED